MCLHSKQEIDRAIQIRESDDKWAVVWWELRGVPQFGADCVEFAKTGEVVSALEWLKECHPTEFAREPKKDWVANMSDVNGKRAAAGILLIDERGGELPPEAQVAGFITTAERGASHA